MIMIIISFPLHLNLKQSAVAATQARTRPTNPYLEEEGDTGVNTVREREMIEK